ncbi:hypothetical protein BC567DRAFT_85446 [Phyllosticta citribraziliensis]
MRISRFVLCWLVWTPRHLSQRMHVSTVMCARILCRVYAVRIKVNMGRKKANGLPSALLVIPRLKNAQVPEMYMFHVDRAVRITNELGFSPENSSAASSRWPWQKESKAAI